MQDPSQSEMPASSAGPDIYGNKFTAAAAAAAPAAHILLPPEGGVAREVGQLGKRANRSGVEWSEGSEVSGAPIIVSPSPSVPVPDLYL